MSNEQSIVFDFAEHYQIRVRQISKEISTLHADVSSSVILLGDSLSEQNPAVTLGDYSVVNMGISGDEIDHPEGGILGRVHLLTAVRPAHVMLLVGINDLNNSGKSVEKIIPRYEALVQAIHSAVPAAKLHLLCLLPTRDAFSRLMPDVKALNAEIERIAVRHGIALVDTHSPLLDGDGALKADYTGDGLHLNAAGYEALNAVLARHLAEFKAASPR